MNKVALKKTIAARQNGKDILSGDYLETDVCLMDTDRIHPKARGGTYELENTRVLHPVTHMMRHGNFRERTPELEELKVMIDGREHIRKFVNSLNNRLLASKRRTDKLDPITQDWIKSQIKEAQSQLGKTDRRIEKYMKSLDMPIVQAALAIRGLGAITVAYMLTYIDIHKAECASAMWSYTGLDKPSHERYTKGESGGGNKTLRTVLYTMADSMIKTRSIYRDVYDAEKRKLEASERMVKSRNTQGKLIECMWKDTKPCHRHGAAIRKLIKHFLADFWFVWRSLEGLPTRPLYVEEYLGHTGIIRPEERGWIYGKHKITDREITTLPKGSILIKTTTPAEGIMVIKTTTVRKGSREAKTTILQKGFKAVKTTTELKGSSNGKTPIINKGSTTRKITNPRKRFKMLKITTVRKGFTDKKTTINEKGSNQPKTPTLCKGSNINKTHTVFKGFILVEITKLNKGFRHIKTTMVPKGTNN